jgi:AAA domain, putative AbiEii toxin, Type IV TA system
MGNDSPLQSRYCLNWAMHLISEIKVTNFRSINEAGLRDLGDFTALAGLNNSGKSNVLRALNAFFTGFTDSEQSLAVDADYYRPNLQKKKAKVIQIAVRFTLPDSFRFRAGIEGVQQFLGANNFEIAKEWNRSSPAPEYFLNGQQVTLENRPKIEQFLALISFRYIPNRVLPLDVVRREHQALRDVLVRRLSRRTEDDRETFEALRTKSVDLIKQLSSRVSTACPDVSEVRLATPSSWREMVFAFGYRLLSGEMVVDDAAQGSGIQSLLMLETLSLIDRDYFQKFGWKQASIWALEEPESSLHSSLEARVCSFLANISSDASSRLQVIATTHSDLVLQFSDKAVFVSKEGNATTFTENVDKREVLIRAAMTGISRYVHPILANPLDPIILVEGKSDFTFLQRAIQLVDPSVRATVSYLEQLQGGPVTGGAEELLRYLKTNLSALRTRLPSAPVIFVLDWDSANKKNEFERLLRPTDPCKVMVWPNNSFNPILTSAFRGLERHLSDRIVNEADQGSLGTKRDGSKTISKDDLAGFKARVLRILERDIIPEDISHSRVFVDEILTTLRGFRPA